MSQLKQAEAGTNRARRFITNTLSFAQKIPPVLQPFSRYIALFICWGLASGIAFFHSGNYDKGADVPLDASWLMGLAASWQQGDWLGRDMFLTYGPFAQFIAAGATTFNVTGSAYNGYGLIVVAFILLSILGNILAIGLLRPLDWKWSVFIFLVCNAMNLTVIYNRAWFIIICALLLGNLLTVTSRLPRLIGAGLLGGFALLAQLFTLDIGIYCYISALTVLVVYSVFARFPNILRKNDLLPYKEYLYVLAVLTLTYLAGNLLIDLFYTLSSPNYIGFLDYQRFAYESLRGYNYAMGTPWVMNWFPTVVLGIVVAYTTGFIILNLRKLETTRSYLLFSLLIFSLFQLKSATVRSEEGHIQASVVALLFTFIVLSFDWLGRGRFRMAWTAVLLLVALSLPWNTLDTFRQVGNIVGGSWSLTLQIKRLANFNPPQADIVASDLARDVDSTKAILPFPFEDYVVIALKRPLVAPVLQSYAAHTELLQQKYVAQLEQKKNTFEVVYGLDGIGSGKLDGVAAITRTPIIFDYLYHNFERKTPQIYDRGFILLKSATEPRQDMIANELQFKPSSENTAALSFIRLAQPANCSLLRLTTKITFPITSLLGRPSTFQLKVGAQNQTIADTNLVTIEPGKPFTTYLPLLEGSPFAEVFGKGPVATRQWDSLQIYPVPGGLFEVRPSSFEISKIECITFQR